MSLFSTLEYVGHNFLSQEENKITNIKPTIRDVTPDLIESSPKSGPTVLSSTTFKGVGRAPDLRRRAKSVASWKEKFPEIGRTETIRFVLKSSKSEPSSRFFGR